MTEVKLRYVTTSDLPILFEYQREPEGNAMATLPARDRDEFYAHWHKILSIKSCIVMAVIADDHVVGHIGSWPQKGRRFVGYWFGKAYWGKGYASKSLVQFVSLHGERPLHAYVAKHNQGSIRVLEKCGFIKVIDEGDDFLYELI